MGTGRNSQRPCARVGGVGRRVLVRSLSAVLALSILAGGPALAGPAPQRIVSLDLCADQLLIELVGRERIAAVTHLAGDPAVSAIPERAKGFPVTHGAAEDVLRHDPDLILAGPFGVASTVSLLRRLNRNLVVVPLPQDLAGVRAAVRVVAAAVGEQARGEAMIAAFDRRLARLPPPAGAPPSAVIYQVGGAVSGAGSIADSALAAAGYRNVSGEYRLTRGGQVPLESLVAKPPDLLVLASHMLEYRTVLADNLRHPAVRALRSHGASLELPWRTWLCGTPHLADAIEELAAARVRLEAPLR